MELPLAIDDTPAIVVPGCWNTVTEVAPVIVLNAESDASVSVKLVVDPLVTVAEAAPLKPCISSSTSAAVIVPTADPPPIHNKETSGVTQITSSTLHRSGEAHQADHRQRTSP